MTGEVWGVWSVRSDASVFGAASAWAKVEGKVFRGSKEEAERLAAEWNSDASGNVRYTAKLVERFIPSPNQ